MILSYYPIFFFKVKIKTWTPENTPCDCLCNYNNFIVLKMLHFLKYVFLACHYTANFMDIFFQILAA